MDLKLWQMKPSLDGTLQLHLNGRAVLGLHRVAADNGEEAATSRQAHAELCQHIVRVLMAAEILGSGGTL